MDRGGILSRFLWHTVRIQKHTQVSLADNFFDIQFLISSLYLVTNVYGAKERYPCTVRIYNDIGPLTDGKVSKCFKNPYTVLMLP
jgi:hypothetical protein